MEQRLRGRSENKELPKESSIDKDRIMTVTDKYDKTKECLSYYSGSTRYSSTVIYYRSREFFLPPYKKISLYLTKPRCKATMYAAAGCATTADVEMI